MRILERITGEKRYMPEIEFEPNLYTHNIFRTLEAVFGRKWGIRCENRTAAWYTEDGKLVVQREFYTVESVLVFAECKVREFFAALSPANWLAPEFTYIQRPAFAVVVLVFLGLEVKLNGGGMLAPMFAGAIAFDAVTNSSANQATGVTISHTSSGSDRLGVGIMLFGGGSPSSSFSSRAATWGGSSMTSRVSGVHTNRGIDIFTRTAQSTGAQNVVYTWSGGGTEDVFVQQSYTGVDQTTPTNGVNETGVTGGTTISVSVTTTVANSVLVGGYFMREGDGGGTPGTNVNERYDNGASYATGDKATTTTGSYALDWTVGSGQIGTDTVIGAIAMSPTASTDVTANAGVLGLTVSTPAPSVSGAANVSASVLSATIAGGGSPAVTGGATVSASALGMTLSIPTVNVITPDMYFQPSAPLALTLDAPDPTVTGDANVTAGVLTATLTVPTPTVNIVQDVTVNASVLTLTVSVQSPAKVGGVWTAQPRVEGEWTPQPRAI